MRWWRLQRGKAEVRPGRADRAAGHRIRICCGELLRSSYYRAKPPKTNGGSSREAFVKRLLATGLAMEDLIATATALTAAAVAEGMDRFVRPRIRWTEPNSSPVAGSTTRS